MPLPAFIIDVPPDTIYLDNVQTGRHETKYIIVTEGESPLFGRSLFIYTWSAPNKKSIHVFDDNVEFFGLDLSSEGESLAEVFEVTEEIREEETRAQELERGWVGRTHRGGGSIFGEELSGKEMRERLLRIVVNTILYLASEGATYRNVHQDLIDEIKESNVGRRKMRPADAAKIKKLEEEPYYDVGTDITLTRTDIDRMLEPSAHRGATGTGRKLSAPSLTRGHWRRQPYGPGRTLRKLKWIKPFIRGKELGGSVRPHAYTLEENPLFGDD